MRTIKIFLASSEELANDRNAFGNLVRRLDDIYEKRRIRIKLEPWEDFDAAYNNRRKQDEYNDKVRASDMFLALFHKKAGRFTIEEFDVASEEFRRTSISPKTYVYCRKLEEEEQESTELKDFKKRLFEEMGHYWSNYDNQDSMQLHFVMQLQLVENSHLDELKVENGDIRFADMTVARMEELRFATDNPDYQRMSQRLTELPQEIEDARLLINDHPDIERYQDKLQKLLDERNRLQVDFNKQQNLLLDTVKRIAALQEATITGRMRRAIEAFERGDVQEANIIFDEAEKDGDARFADFERKEAIRNKEIKNIHSDIECLLMQTTTVMADATIPIQERINKTIELYKKADLRASRTNYDGSRLNLLLFVYGKFLLEYDRYSDSIKVYLRLIDLYEEETPNIAKIYSNLGLAYKSLDDYDNAFECYFKALTISECHWGKNHINTAMINNNIGNVYRSLENYTKALDHQLEALAIIQKQFGKKHHYTAQQLNNIGNVYLCMDDYNKAREYLFRAIKIYEETLGRDHPNTATSYNNLGSVFYKMGNYSEALSYYTKALEIREKKLGNNHPDTLISYKNISNVYKGKGYGYTKWASDKASLCRNMGFVFDFQDDSTDNYETAMQYFQKSLGKNDICEASDISSSKEMRKFINEISTIKDLENRQALDYYNRILKVREDFYGADSCYVADIYSKIGLVYYNMREYENALSYYKKTLAVFEKEFGITHPYVVKMRKIINLTKQQLSSKSINKD